MSPSSSVYVPGTVRTTQSPLYDSLSILTATPVNPTGTTKMFGNVQGLSSVGPNITNMQQAFQLSGGESFLVKSLRVVFIGTAQADIVSFCQNNTIRLIIGAGNTWFCDAPAEYWSGGAGVSGGTSASANNGIPDPRAIVPFDTDPILLTDGVNFRVEIVGNTFTSTAAFFMRVYLDGQRTQPAS
jgi:hypothetical protein